MDEATKRAVEPYLQLTLFETALGECRWPLPERQSRPWLPRWQVADTLRHCLVARTRERKDGI
jgi:hypothetical protein